MKRLKRITALLLILLFSMSVLTVSETSKASVKNSFRGLWVSTVLNIDYPTKPTTNSEVLKSEAIKILDNAKNTGFNAVFLQVRPASDALYKSKYYPWSKYLTGSQGVEPGNDFDPLKFWVEEAHKRGIELHAWINPYRVSKKTASEKNHDFSLLHSSSPARINPNWVVKHSDGNLYFNPGLPEVRNLVINGVLEIVNNYDVDGIHFDDYFYPGKNFDDAATYKKYGASYKNVDDWRRANVNTLISDLSKAIKKTNKKVRFGISPFGIWANKSSNSLGSDTKGSQSYYDHYADTRKWVKEGWIDYIAPQLYWNIGYSIADYSKLLSWWNNTVSGTKVDLYIGQAAYRLGDSNSSSPWYGVGEVEKQLKLNAKTSGVKGSIFFTYNSFGNNPGISAAVKALFEQEDGVVATKAVSISKPSGNIKTTYDQYYINGSSDPKNPLYVNGKLVSGRSSKGYYGVLVPLKEGVNIITVSQKGSYKSCVIYRNPVSNTPAKMSTAEIPASSAFPQTQEYRSPGEKVTLSCIAPAGAKVTVKLGGKSYTMKPSTTASYGTGIYGITYTCVYTVPSYSGNPRIINLGSPVYTMSYNGKQKSRTAPAKIGVIMKNYPYYAKVQKNVIDTYGTPSTENGAAFELYKGMIDYVTGMTGNFARLSSGQWVKKDSVSIYSSKTKLNPVIKKASYKVDNKWDTLQIDISSLPAVFANYDGKQIKLTVPLVSSGKVPTLPKNSVISSVKTVKTGGLLQYTLTVKDKQRIEGYYIDKTSSGFVLKIKRQIKASEGSKPLTGITIMLDPGHGGSESGAIGPLGLSNAEKTINLNTALKLQSELKALGAKVIMTRSSDKVVSLADRLAASRNSRPDMFISIHANSMADNVDISKKSGLSVYYREKTALPLGTGLYNQIIKDLNRDKDGIRNKNFYVIRGTWTPSILIESGFVPNPNEFEWLTDSQKQTEYAKTISKAIVNYFKS